MFFFLSGCVYTPKCTPVPSNAMDGPVSMVMMPGNMLYVVNSNQDTKYCSSFISKISLLNAIKPAYSGVIKLNYDGSDISLVGSSYLSDNGLLWITDRSNNRVLIFDTSVNAITGSVAVDQDPISITSAGNINGDQLLLVCDMVSNDVSVVSAYQKKELYRIDLTNNGSGVLPLFAAVMPFPISVNNQAPDTYGYITRGDDNNISVISLNDQCEFNPMYPSSASQPVFNTVIPDNTATMSSVKTVNCQTKSELWTITFSSETNDFDADGSVSGLMKKHPQIGIPYTSDNGYVSFTIYPSHLPYKTGDNFTFYTTASTGLINIPNLPGTGTATAIPATKDAVITPDGTKLFVSYAGLDSIVVIYTADNTIERYIKVGKSPDALLLSTDGSTLYAACLNSGSIYVINTNSESVIARIGVGNGPFSMVLSQDQRYLYVLNYIDNSIDVIDLSDFSLVDTLK